MTKKDDIKTLAVVLVMAWFGLVSLDAHDYLTHWHANIQTEMSLHGPHRRALVHLFY